MSARVPAGEFRCDFFDFGCAFVAESRQAEARHYNSDDVRQDHVHLVTEKLRALRNEIDRLKQHQERHQKEIDQLRQEIAELKRRITQLEAERQRVCTVWQPQVGALLEPQGADWHRFRTEEFGYSWDIRAHLAGLAGAPAGQPLGLRFKLRLRPTPHDATLAWPFRSKLRVEIFPPDGHPNLLGDGCRAAELEPEGLSTDQLWLLERPVADDEGAASLELQLPLSCSFQQLQVLPPDSSLAVRVAWLPPPRC